MRLSRGTIRQHFLVATALGIMAVLVGISAPLGATTLIREGIDELVATNQRVVVGEVTGATSYWNEDKTFILTDVKIAPDETLKGRREKEITVTLLGGRVGELTTLIVGGAELVPGRSYVLFLNPETLPGGRRALTVADHCQGAFEVRMKGGELRAISQANRHALVPDRGGVKEAPGGVDGFALDILLRDVRSAVKRQETRR